MTKKPPFIQLSSSFGFSLKDITSLLKFENLTSPNLAAGLTAVTVTNFLFSL